MRYLTFRRMQSMSSSIFYEPFLMENIYTYFSPNVKMHSDPSVLAKGDAITYPNVKSGLWASEVLEISSNDINTFVSATCYANAENITFIYSNDPYKDLTIDNNIICLNTAPINPKDDVYVTDVIGKVRAPMICDIKKSDIVGVENAKASLVALKTIEIPSENINSWLNTKVKMNIAKMKNFHSKLTQGFYQYSQVKADQSVQICDEHITTLNYVSDTFEVINSIPFESTIDHGDMEGNSTFDFAFPPRITSTISSILDYDSKLGHIPTKQITSDIPSINVGLAKFKYIPIDRISSKLDIPDMQSSAVMEAGQREGALPISPSTITATSNIKAYVDSYRTASIEAKISTITNDYSHFDFEYTTPIRAKLTTSLNVSGTEVILQQTTPIKVNLNQSFTNEAHLNVRVAFRICDFDGSILADISNLMLSEIESIEY